MSAESNNKNRGLRFVVSINGSQPGSVFASRGHMAMSRDSFGCHNRRKRVLLASSEQVEARDAAEHPTMCRTAPPTKYHLAQNVHRAKPTSRNSGPVFS